MSDDELANKFRECAAWGRLPQANAEKVIVAVFNLEKMKNVRELTKLLQTGARSHSRAKSPAVRKRR
jgi:hypothetical protein